MSYSLEEIYAAVGRDDKVAVLNFYEHSEAFNLLGESLTVVFTYTQKERQEFEIKYWAPDEEKTYGKITASYLGFDLAAEAEEHLNKTGVDTRDIKFVSSLIASKTNVFRIEEQRTIQKIEVKIKKDKKGGDYDWMYGFKKKLVVEGVGHSPYDREWYLAMKLFFEAETITSEQSLEIYVDGKLRPEIEEKFLEIKFDREIITEVEQLILEQLWYDSMERNLSILNQELNDAGTSLKKIARTNRPLYHTLSNSIYQFKPIQINIKGAKAIYLDYKGFLHVFLRHVAEFKLEEQFPKKDNFLWSPGDVITVIQKVIESVNDEVQDFWKRNPEHRFSKYGDQSLYFEGDYYTFHIEVNGRISTFHRNRKNILKESKF